MILRPAAPLPPTSKTMKIMTVPCIFYDSEASRPLPPTSKTMKMMAAQRKDDTEPSEFEVTELEMNRVRNECCVRFLVFLVIFL